MNLTKDFRKTQGVSNARLSFSNSYGVQHLFGLSAVLDLDNLQETAVILVSKGLVALIVQEEALESCW